MQKANLEFEFKKIKSLRFLYEINENGTIIRNVKSKKQLKIKLDYHHSEKGYYTTFVHLGGRKNPVIKRVTIHRAVAECWLGDIPEGYQVDHIDRNPHNNHYTNLRYVTVNQQMKNRDHSNISAKGSINLENARRMRMIPVKITNGDYSKTFESKAECSRFLGEYYHDDPEKFRYRLKRKSSHIKDFDISYLNAETIHGGSTEQEIVH